MLDHVSLGTHNLDKSGTFYTRVLGVLDYRVQKRTEQEIVFGPGEAWTFVLYPALEDQPVVGVRAHVALYAPDRARASAFYAQALTLGAEPLREVAHRPEFGADYFGGMFRDLDGHVIEILTRA